MGIHDRDYYRPERPAAGAGLLSSVTRWLMAINIGVFLAQFFVTPQTWLGQQLDLDTERILKGEVWRLVTYAFVHSTTSWAPIVFNMLALWMFGEAVESIHGPREFSAFYLAAVLLAAVAHVALELLFRDGANGVRPFVPIHGAIWPVVAVMCLFACHFPNHTVYILFVLPVPVAVLVILLVLQDTLGILGHVQSDTAGLVSHVLCIAFAYLYNRNGWRVLNLLPRARGRWRPSVQRGPRLRVFERPEPDSDDEPEPVSVSSRPNPERDLEAQLDLVLVKVARSGKASLTEQEHQVLLRASEIYKQRRK